jgi:hypothetical protein
MNPIIEDLLAVCRIEPASLPRLSLRDRIKAFFGMMRVQPVVDPDPEVPPSLQAAKVRMGFAALRAEAGEILTWLKMSARPGANRPAGSHADPLVGAERLLLMRVGPMQMLLDLSPDLGALLEVRDGALGFHTSVETGQREAIRRHVDRCFRLHLKR